VWCPSTAFAKPPDLPAAPRIVCETPPQPQPAPPVAVPPMFAPGYRPVPQLGLPVVLPGLAPDFYGQEHSEDCPLRQAADHCAGRRVMFECLLFGVHPLLLWVPVPNWLPVEEFFEELEAPPCGEVDLPPQKAPCCATAKPARVGQIIIIGN